MNTTLKYAYSWDDESYTGTFPSKEEAIAEAFGEWPERVNVFVGEVVYPSAPEIFIDADTIIDAIINQEEYSGEYTQDWPIVSKEQKQELTDSLQRIVSEWIAKHNLQPNWYTVPDSEEVTNDSTEY